MNTQSLKDESLKQKEHRESYLLYKDDVKFKHVSKPIPATPATPNNTPDTTGKPPLAPLLQTYAKNPSS